MPRNLLHLPINNCWLDETQSESPDVEEDLPPLEEVPPTTEQVSYIFFTIFYVEKIALLLCNHAFFIYLFMSIYPAIPLNKFRKSQIRKFVDSK